MRVQVKSAVELVKANLQGRMAVAKAQEAMRGHCNYTIESNQSAIIVEFLEMVEFKMLYLLLI